MIPTIKGVNFDCIAQEGPCTIWSIIALNHQLNAIKNSSSSVVNYTAGVILYHEYKKHIKDKELY